ncbi:hypothetical protein [uncultured Friedmanniella sp.]|uniref:hypothetical protein n=1 Tax=uncultured Friedmanniella sp. TaxID=335381 RepID=UPI0035C9A50C
MPTWRSAAPTAEAARGLVRRPASAAVFAYLWTVAWDLSGSEPLTSTVISTAARTGADLADLAVRLGWYDQAPLTNAFGRMLGETPAQDASRSRPPS